MIFKKQIEYEYGLLYIVLKGFYLLYFKRLHFGAFSWPSMNCSILLGWNEASPHKIMIIDVQIDAFLY